MENKNLTVTIQDSVLSCTKSTNSSCLFVLSVSVLTLRNTTLLFPDIRIETASAISLTNSFLLTNGTMIGGDGSPPNLRNGVAYAAQGATCNSPAIDLSYGLYNEYYNSSEKWNSFGSGYHDDPQNSLGGGRIVLLSHRDLTIINTTLNASGLGKCPNEVVVNGGTGGYVWIEKTLPSGKEQIEDAKIDVSGGCGCRPKSEIGQNRKTSEELIGFGGSGGRVLISMEKEDSFLVNLQGGGNSLSSDKCTRGGAGTLYSLKSKTLSIKNGNQPTDSPTILDSQTNVPILKVSDQALVSFRQDEQVSVTVSTLMLTQGNIKYQNCKSSIIFNAVDLHLTASSSITLSTANASLISCQFLVDASSSIISHWALLSFPMKFCEVLSFSISGTLKADKIPVQNYNTPSTIIILFPLPFQLQGEVSFDNIFLFSNGTGNVGLTNVIINSDMRTCLQESSFPPFNPLLEDRNSTSKTPLNLTDFMILHTGSPSLDPLNMFMLVKQIISPVYTTFLFVEDSLQVISGTVLSSARIGIFSRNFIVSSDSKISSTGKGCSSGIGTGLINKDLVGFCPGSGGSYGGLGGAGLSQLGDPALQTLCEGLLGTPNGRKEHPYFEGSGGGGSDSLSLGGRGGGVVILGVKQGIVNGSVESNGFLGNIPSDSLTGSGSGGSIQIHTLDRLGGSGKVSADGGPQTVKGGGFGGGGRIMINYLGWEQRTTEVKASEGKVTFSAKSGDLSTQSDLYAGSISMRPCLPGYYGFTCMPCELGTYKDDFGNGECLPCANKLGNSFFSRTAEYNYLCEYECEKGLVSKSENPTCLSNFDFYTRNFGGVYGVIAAAATVLTLIFFILKKIIFQEQALKKILRPTATTQSKPYYGRRQTKEHSRTPKAGKKASFHLHEPWRVLSLEDNFLMEDLPYLKYRFFIKGSNTPKNPWFLSEEPPREIAREVYKVEFQQFYKELNKKCVYAKEWIFLLDLLLLIYAPLYLVLLRYLQKKVVDRVREFLKQADYNFWKLQRCRVFPFCMKLSTTKNYMLGSVEVLDYKQNFDEWDHKDLFPIKITLGGRGSFYHPLQLNLADPIVAGMQLTFDEVFKNDYRLDEFEINLNKEEEHEKESLRFLLEFNKLSRQIDFGAFQDWFVRKVMKTIVYIDTNNKKLFNLVDLNIEWFAEISPKPGQTLKTHSILIDPESTNPSVFDRSSSVMYMLSQDSPNFSVENIKKIHHVYHYDPTASIQFCLRITYKNQSEKQRHFSFNDRLIRENYISKSSFGDQETELDIQNLKEKLFDRLEQKGDLASEPVREVYYSGEKSPGKEDLPLKLDVDVRPGSIWSRIKRVFNIARYFALGYRQWIVQKYILTVIILLLFAIDVVLLIFCHEVWNTILRINLPFPFAIYVMPIGGIFWIAGTSSITIGKVLLTFNIMSLVNIIQALIVGEQYLLLITVLFIKTITVPFGCQYVSYLDNIKDTVN